MSQEKLYQKGFNAGYLLSQHEPVLIEKILKSNNKDNEYFEGLLFGKKEYDREVFREELKQTRERNQREKGYGRDI